MAAIYVVGVLALFVASTGAFVVYEQLLPMLARRDVEDECDISECFRSLRSYLHPTTGFKLEKIDDNQALNQLCSVLHSAEACVHGLVAIGCAEGRPMRMVVVETIEGVVGYMCGAEGRAALLSEQACWENTELEGNLQDCSDQLTDNAVIDDDDQMCGAIEEFRNCSFGVVDSACSGVAVHFMDGLTYRLFEPFARFHFNCDLRERIKRNLVASIKHLLKR